MEPTTALTNFMYMFKMLNNSISLLQVVLIACFAFHWGMV